MLPVPVWGADLGSLACIGVVRACDWRMSVGLGDLRVADWGGRVCWWAIRGWPPASFTVGRHGGFLDFAGGASVSVRGRSPGQAFLGRDIFRLSRAGPGERRVDREPPLPGDSRALHDWAMGSAGGIRIVGVLESVSKSALRGRYTARGLSFSRFFGVPRDGGRFEWLAKDRFSDISIHVCGRPRSGVLQFYPCLGYHWRALSGRSMWNRMFFHAVSEIEWHTRKTGVDTSMTVGSVRRWVER